MAIDEDLLDRLLEGRDPSGPFARDGLLDDPRKALSERILNAELEAHLDGGRDEAGVPARPANSRNGSSPETVLTGTSKVRLGIPRDRAGTFDPRPIARYRRRVPDFDDPDFDDSVAGPHLDGHRRGPRRGRRVVRAARWTPVTRWSSSTRSG